MFNSRLLKKIEKIEVLGCIENDQELGLVTDSRNIGSEAVFLAIEGEKFDGFYYLEQAIEKGCRYLIYNLKQSRESKVKELFSKNPECIFIGVKDSIETLQELACEHRKAWNGLVVGITGSNGKTTTKEMLSHLFQGICPGKVLYTKGNLNNHIGVPLTLLNISKHHDFAIIEMGTNHPGEIARLCEIALPNAGLITNIGEAHLEFLGSKLGILKEKASLYDSIMMNKDTKKVFVLNKDDEYLRTLNENENVLSIGEKTGKLNYEFIGNEEVELLIEKKRYRIKNKELFGKYNFVNLLQSLVLANAVIPGHIQELIKLAESFRLPSNNRSTWLEKGHLKIFADAYNANPSSMKASLCAFNDFLEERKISKSDCLVVLGDMNELGGEAAKHHKKIGDCLAELKFSDVAYIGRYASAYREGFPSNKVFESTKEFLKYWEKASKNYKYLYLKGSRTLQLESIIDITY